MSKKMLFLIIMLLPLTLCAQQEKEVLSIGTMHAVPGSVQNSYEPLLKRALDYKPQAIYVEYLMPDDVISWSYMKDGWSAKAREFYKLSDSVQAAFLFQQEELDKLLKKDIAGLSKSELDIIIASFAYQRDYASYSFYSYVKQYGAGGSKKPLRNEHTDLSFKLALQLGINRLYGIDDQQAIKEYNQALNDCIKFGELNGDTKILQTLEKKDTRAAIVPSLIGRLGVHINKPKSLYRKHTINSARYVTQKNDACSNCTDYWDERNSRIANNLLKQLNRSNHQKSVVIIGAAHVFGLKEAIQKQNPAITVRLLEE